ncbi:MAG: T9SS type A sorting domain-containing protein [Dysgonamonadaceae bacterium]|jgi:hypothetical protein|nr:T9SS type A sorting domain-containing protein [Dysgonamonadaceae bacterium]
MKRKLFTLFVAIVAIATFQANAQQQWILADMSGLAKNTLKDDPYPNNKTGLYNWLSVKNGEVYVHSRVNINDSDEIYDDEHNKFTVTEEDPTGYPDRFSIKWGDGNNTATWLDWNGDKRSWLEIVQFPSDKRTPMDISKSNPLEGYLALHQTGNNIMADSPELVLAGVNINDGGKISFKKFSDFGAHLSGDGETPVMSYQMRGEMKAGRLYHSTNDYFQTYYPAKPDTTLIVNGGFRKNWNVNTQDSVYTYLDLHVSDGKITVKGKGKAVRLDSIVNHLKRANIAGIDSFRIAERQNNNLYFCTGEDGALQVTAAVAGTENEWTNGEPTPYGAYGMDTCYFAIDTRSNTIKDAFESVFKELFKIENPFLSNNTGALYIDKTGGAWRPLYIQVINACDAEPVYKYVDLQWMESKNYDLGAALQKTVDALGNVTGAVSDSATIVAATASNLPKFFFEFADTIGSSHRIRGLNEEFNNSAQIDLFHIRNGSKYLTVLDTTIFANLPTPDSTVTNTQLGWKPKITSSRADALRQAFAIVYDNENDIVTFQPVVAYKWKSTGGKASYGKKLHYNKNIGKVDEPDLSSLFPCRPSLDQSEIWYITQLSKSGVNQPQRLVIADPTSKVAAGNETVWFKTDVTVNGWTGQKCGSEQAVAIFNADKTRHYTAKELVNGGSVTAEDIRSHWNIKKTSTIKSGEKTFDQWVFTPEIDTIYGNAQWKVLKDTVIAIDLGSGKIELINKKKLPYTRDTIRTECVDNAFSPFLNIDIYADASKQIALVGAAFEDKNISYFRLDKDSVQPVPDAIDSILEVFLKQVGNTKSSYAWVKVYKSNVQYLGGQNKTHEVPYYIFSYNAEDKEYFLKTDTSVRWVYLNPSQRETLLDADNWDKTFAPYKFCLPYLEEASEKVYLQTLDHAQTADYALITSRADTIAAVKFSAAVSTATNYTAKEGIYSAIEQYESNMKTISGWIIVGEDLVESNWARINAAVDASDAFANGVFTEAADGITEGTTFLAPSSEAEGGTKDDAVNYGVMTDIGQRVELTLEYTGATKIGYAKDSIWYYNVIYNDRNGNRLYLTDAKDSTDAKYEYSYFIDNETALNFTYAFFTPSKVDYRKEVYADSAFRQTFALKYTEPVADRKHYYLTIVSSANYKSKLPIYRYLSRVRERLVFGYGEAEALKLQWGKIADGKYTNIKEVGAPAKVYGVAGGVKVPDGGSISIYTIDGRLVTAKVALPAQTIAVPAGIYIVRNGEDVTKVIVK